MVLVVVIAVGQIELSLERLVGLFGRVGGTIPVVFS